MKKICLLLVLLLCLSACAAETAPAPVEPAPEEDTAIAAVPDAPAEPEEVPAAPAEPAVPSCTISIDCSTILNNLDQLDEEKLELVPEDGILLAETVVPLEEGDTVFDVLQRVTQEQKLQMEFSTAPLYDSKYIEGIANLYEMDCGPLSGWTFSVNGEFPTYGLNQHTLHDGDVVRLLYSCDLGADVGNPRPVE